MTSRAFRGGILAVGVLAAATFLPTGAMASSAAGMRSMAVKVAFRYLAGQSSDGPSDGDGIPYGYGETVRFRGRTLTPDQMDDEKRREAIRWPVRRYSHRPGTLRVSCNVRARKCAVRSTVDYRVSDPGRRASASGSMRFDLGVGLDGPRPRILYEDGGLPGPRPVPES